MALSPEDAARARPYDAETVDRWEAELDEMIRETRITQNNPAKIFVTDGPDTTGCVPELARRFEAVGWRVELNRTSQMTGLYLYERDFMTDGKTREAALEGAEVMIEQAYPCPEEGRTG